MNANFDKLHDGKTYKVYRDVNGLMDWLFGRYTVTAPLGNVLKITATLWGARRVIRKHQAKVLRDGTEKKWWDKPIAAEFPRRGGAS